MGIGPHMVSGEPSRELMDAFEAAKEAQKIVAGMLKPGVHPGDLLKANNEYLGRQGICS